MGRDGWILEDARVRGRVVDRGPAELESAVGSDVQRPAHVGVVAHLQSHVDHGRGLARREGTEGQTQDHVRLPDRQSVYDHGRAKPVDGIRMEDHPVPHPIVDGRLLDRRYRRAQVRSAHEGESVVAVVAEREGQVHERSKSGVRALILERHVEGDPGPDQAVKGVGKGDRGLGVVRRRADHRRVEEDGQDRRQEESRDC